MSFTMKNIENVKQILEMVKDSKDIELHMDMGDMKLSLWKGEAVNGAGRSQAAGAEGLCCARPAESASLATQPAPAVQIETPPVPPATPAATKAEIPEAAENEAPEGLVPIKASVTSVFYRKPSPDEPPFVEVGDEVEEDSVICLLEVMKYFRSINASVKGRIEKILVESGQLVEYGDVMFLIDPA